MSIKLRLALLVGLLLVVFFSSLAAMHTMERRQYKETIAATRREEAEILGRWLDLGAAPLRRFVEDMSLAPDSALEPAYLSAARLHAGLDAAWLTDSAGAVLFADPASPAILGFAGPVLSRARAGGLHYFADIGGVPHELRARQIARDRWIVAARRWDEPHLLHLGGLTGGKIRLLRPDEMRLPENHPDYEPPAEAEVLVLRPLPDFSGKPTLYLRLEKPAPEISFRAEADQLKTKIFLAFGVCLIGSLALSLHGWIMRPLDWITHSLTRHDPAPIAPLLKENTEFTRVARLIVRAFEHREHLRREIAERRHAQAELQRTLDERARLGRDLHDSVIQSIYAAGMGIVAARKLSPARPDEAERRLALVGELLNDTIRDVRDFITGLEPESLGKDSLPDAVARLFAAVNPSDTARADIDLDEDVVARLDAGLRTELLLVLREALSNAIRHGGATQVEIALLPVGEDRARLRVADNGRGFDPATVRRGRGLGNLATRARLRGARFELDSRPGEGARLALEFPLHPETPAAARAETAADVL